MGWIGAAGAYGLSAELRSLGYLISIETKMVGNKQMGRVMVTGHPVTSRDFYNASSDSERVDPGPDYGVFGRKK